MAALTAAIWLVVSLPEVPTAEAAVPLQGAGSSFPQLQIEQWRSDVAKSPYGLSVNYVSSGSTFGRTQYIQGNVDFGVSDIAFQRDEIHQAVNRPYTYVTISAAGVGFMYNLRDAAGKRIGFSVSNGGTGTDLKLTPRTVCRLFSEPNMMWNDPELQADNPGIQLPNERVQPVFRADGSGTGFAVQEYCIASAKDVWDTFVQYVANTPALRAAFEGDPFLEGRPSSKWPVFAGQSAFASDGVANVVATDSAGKNGIAYVEAGFAEVRGFPNALVKNAAGSFHFPESGNVNRALTHARRNNDATVTLDYVTPDPEAYFPASYSYAIVPIADISPDKAASLGTFLNYAITTGQQKADLLGYAPLPPEVMAISLDEVQRIPGAPPRPEIPGETPPPTAAVTTIGVCYDGTVGQKASTGRFTYRSQSNVPKSGFSLNQVEGTDQPVPFEVLVGDDQLRQSTPYVLPVGSQDRILWTIAGTNAAGSGFGPTSARLESANTTITSENLCGAPGGEPPSVVPEAPLTPLLAATAGATMLALVVVVRRRGHDGASSTALRERS